MKNFIAKGKVATIIAAAVIAAGDFLKVGSGGLVGIAASSAGVGEETEVVLTGVFELPKAAIAISQGDKLYYVDADRNLSKTAAGNTFAGYAYDDAAAGDETVKLLLANGI
jgi:predicted RecA/RadA family phage recombinase